MLTIHVLIEVAYMPNISKQQVPFSAISTKQNLFCAIYDSRLCCLFVMSWIKKAHATRCNPNFQGLTCRFTRPGKSCLITLFAQPNLILLAQVICPISTLGLSSSAMAPRRAFALDFFSFELSAAGLQRPQPGCELLKGGAPSRHL
jgi:hypothetical protein